MIPFILLDLGIGLMLAGIVLFWAGRIYRKRMRDPELVFWAGGIAILVGILLITIVVFWN